MMTELKATLNTVRAIVNKADSIAKYHENMRKLKEMRKELDLKYETLYPTK